MRQNCLWAYDPNDNYTWILGYYLSKDDSNIRIVVHDRVFVNYREIYLDPENFSKPICNFPKYELTGLNERIVTEVTFIYPDNTKKIYKVKNPKNVFDYGNL